MTALEPVHITGREACHFAAPGVRCADAERGELWYCRWVSGGEADEDGGGVPAEGPRQRACGADHLPAGHVSQPGRLPGAPPNDSAASEGGARACHGRPPEPCDHAHEPEDTEQARNLFARTGL